MAGKYLNKFREEYEAMLNALRKKYNVEIQQDDTFYSSCGNLLEQNLTIRNSDVDRKDIQETNR